MPEYIPIPDFAQRAGVTRQAVYKRIDKDLKTFIKLVDGKKLLNTNALTLFKQTETMTTVEKPYGNQTTDIPNQQLSDQVNQLSNQLAVTVAMLQAEQAENRKLTDQLIALSTDFSDLAKQSNLLLSQSQTLQGHMQERTLGVQTSDNETTVDGSVCTVGKKVNQSETTAGPQADGPKGNWFARIFG